MKNAVSKIVLLIVSFMCISTCNFHAMAQDSLKVQDLPATPNMPQEAQPIPQEQAPEAEPVLSPEEAFARELAIIEIADKLLSYNNQLLRMESSVQESTMEMLTELDKEIATIDVKWNLYNQSNQMDIASSDSLLQIAAEYQLIKQELTDSITGQKNMLDAIDTFSKAEELFAAQQTAYADLYAEGEKYSYVEKLTPLLEKLKVKEQLIFAEIQTAYDNSKAASEAFPLMHRRFEQIETSYIELKTTSDKIQALEYKTLFQRFKDYLLGLAAVSMILMFVNLVVTKIKAWKQGIESAKKMKELFKQNDNQYPTI